MWQDTVSQNCYCEESEIMSITNPQRVLEDQIAEINKQAEDQRELAESCQAQSKAALAKADDLDAQAGEFQAALDLLNGQAKTRAAVKA